MTHGKGSYGILMKKWVTLGHKIIGSGIFLITIALIFLPNFAMLEFLNEYLLHYVIFLLISGLIGLILNNRIILYVSFGSAFMLTLFLKYNSNTNLKLPKPNNQPTLGLVHVNLSSVTSADILQSLTKETNYDVISFQELTPDWDMILQEIFRDSFPFSFIDVKPDVQGKAVFSRYKMEVFPNTKVGDINILQINFYKNEEVYKLYSSYLTPPLNQKNKNNNEEELKGLSLLISESPTPAFVFGELNRVYWAKPIIEFRKKTNMVNSRRNIPLSFKTAYGHIFYSPDMECYHFEDIFDETNTSVGCKGLYQKKKLVSKKNRFRRDDN